jgi:hypothetical protein
MPITRDEAIKQVVAELIEPSSVEEVVRRVLAIWPSTARTAANSIRQGLRHDHAGKTLIFLTDQTLAPIGLALRGVQFRIILSRQEVERGLTFVQPNFTCFLPYQVPAEMVKFVDAAGRPIPTRIVNVKHKEKTIFGLQTYDRVGFDLGQWFKQHRVKRDDSLLVTVEDWEAREFRLVHEPAKIRQQRRTEIEKRSQELADLLFGMLETARYEFIWANEAILTAYTRLSNPTGYPGDHWLTVIERDGRMRWNGTDIRYPDSYTPFERLLGEEAPPARKVSVPARQARQVYQFKAAFHYNKSIWRRIEMQGRHTLADFDRELRRAFKHDTWDHLGGFWKLVPRGQTRRFREVELGTVDPMGKGEGAEVKIASLDLQPDDELKYVYDFGDWIEHRLTLEAISEPQAGVNYPRLVEQNKPRYQYCRHCQEEGKKTVATWVCITCSNQEQADVLVCENCLDTHHQDHYTEEMVY